MSIDGAFRAKRIAVLITTHNRLLTLLQCLESLDRQDPIPGISVEVFVVDDGSTDGTSTALRERFPEVNVICGSGDLFWNRGMVAAMTRALVGDYDFYLLLNDDTRLVTTALRRLLDAMKLKDEGSFRGAIVVGATVNNGAETTSTYGGWVSHRRWAPISMGLLALSNNIRRCDTFNGNCVLLSRRVVFLLGILDAKFTHGMGDFDYGLRARRAGIASWVVPGFVGHCESNSGSGSWVDESLGLGARWRLMLGPKGLPFQEWKEFTSRHAGFLWPVYWLSPYVRFWVKGIALRIFGRGIRSHLIA